MNILITGAGGFLGTHLLTNLQGSEHRIYALTSKKEEIKNKFGFCKVFSIREWENNQFPISEIDIVVHCAFARANKGGKNIAKSLSFSSDLFRKFIRKKVKGIINISTQEVYGEEKTPWTEKIANPKTVYGVTKYFSELHLKKLAASSMTTVTNIRLAGLLGIETENRMVNKFIKNVVLGKPIKILDGQLLFSQLDIRDAVWGIISLVDVPLSKWKGTYNLGFIKSYYIDEIAEIVKKIGKRFDYEVEILREPSEMIIKAEMDSTVFYKDTGWTPEYDMKRIIEFIFRYEKNKL